MIAILKIDPASGSEVLINVCHTTMVALDAQTLRPRKVAGNEPPPVPPLAIETASPGLSVHSCGGSSRNSSTANTPSVEEAQARQAERASLAEWHKAIRSARTQATMQIRQPVSAPPTEEVREQMEMPMKQLHYI